MGEGNCGEGRGEGDKGYGAPRLWHGPAIFHGKDAHATKEPRRWPRSEAIENGGFLRFK